MSDDQNKNNEGKGGDEGKQPSAGPTRGIVRKKPYALHELQIDKAKYLLGDELSTVHAEKFVEGRDFEMREPPRS